MILNLALNRPVHGGPTITYILSKLTNACYVILIDARTGYHNLKLDKNSSYLTIFACPFVWYRIPKLLFRVAPVGDMFQEKIVEIFKGI